MSYQSFCEHCEFHSQDRNTPDDSFKVCVVGAGVNGLCSAVCIQEHIPDATVTIIADKFDVDTLSDGAAGLFRPTESLQGPRPDSIRQWAYDAYSYYKSVAKSADCEKAGIKELSGYILAEEDKRITENKLLEDILPVWREASSTELKKYPGNWKYGCYFTTVLVDCRRFLPWMTQRFYYKGGKIMEKHIHDFEKLFDQYDLVVNCTGFNARYLCDDNKMVPIRGQVFKVLAPWVQEFVYKDYDTYIIPGFDTVTLGGTRQYDSFDTKVNKYNSKEIWEKCCSLIPSLKDATVVREFVGLRPHRNIIRLSLDYVNWDKKYPIIHNYGHGGFGVSLAWGCAKEVAQLSQRVYTNKSFA